MNVSFKLIGGIVWTAVFLLVSGPAPAAEWATLPAKPSPGNGKNIVLLAGDEEYRSEESLPMLAKILSEKHGFNCTVLFSVNPADGTIDPMSVTNVPGMEQLDKADLVICQFRWRELPDADMKHFVDYARSGKPMIALRTATHPFNYTRNTNSPYANYDWRDKNWPGGFGQQVFGETWVDHHGSHGNESTRGVINSLNSHHPVLNGVTNIWGPTDVYTIKHVTSADTVLLHGQVLKGMKPDDQPNLNKALMPIVWIHQYTWDNGVKTRTLTSTIGAAVDMQSEDLRRLVINACYWLTGLEVPLKANATVIGDYQPSYFGMGKFIPGRKPADFSTP